MIRITNRLVVAALFIGATDVALAADFNAPPAVVSYAPTTVADPGTSGWYLRGDVGVGVLSQGKWEDTQITPFANVNNSGWLKRTIGDTTFIGVGVGYQFNDYLRGDITAQYRNTAAVHGANYIFDTTANAQGQNVINGQLSSTVLMANGYWDITKFNGLTPYIGAGLGVAYNRMTGFNTITTGSFQGQYGQYKDGGQLNFAYALHTGVSWDVNSRLKLEAGYTFQSLGSSKSTLVNCYSAQGAQACNEPLKIKDIASNDFHIGMRWLLDPVEQPRTVYRSAPQPVVAKY